MSTVGQNTQQLQQDIQFELTTANQILRLISIELQQIKNFTNPGGELESTIRHNAELTTALARLQQIDIENLSPLTRKYIGLDSQENHNESNNDQDIRKEESLMDDSQ